MRRFTKIALASVAAFGVAVAAVAVVAQQGPMQRGGMMESGMGSSGHHGGMMGGAHSYAMATFDTDGDGVLSPEEMTAGIRAELGIYDTDANGTLSLEEFSAMHAAHTQPMTVRVFQMHDADGDAQVTEEEMAAMVEMMEDHMAGGRGGNRGMMGNN